MSRYVSSKQGVVSDGWKFGISPDYRMLAKISKSFKGSLGNLMSESYESSNPNQREYSGSVVSESAGYSMGRNREKRKSKRYSQMFGSDVHKDYESDFNMRSVSMVSLSVLL